MTLTPEAIRPFPRYAIDLLCIYEDVSMGPEMGSYSITIHIEDDV